jgi:hypothetical protein
MHTYGEECPCGESTGGEELEGLLCQVQPVQALP